MLGNREAVVRLHGCTSKPEPSLVAYMIVPCLHGPAYMMIMLLKVVLIYVIKILILHLTMLHDD